MKCVGALVTLILFGPVLTCQGQEQSVDYIYIDSSVDEAAGGHAAIRLAETVFHFQFYDEGYFLIEKTPWDQFRHQYNDRQNRSLAIASIPVSQATYERIRHRFLARYLLQERRFVALEELQREQTILETISQGNAVIPIAGLGYFDTGRSEDPSATVLREFIAGQLGRGYLAGLQTRLAEQCRQASHHLKPARVEYDTLELYSPSLTFSSSLGEYLELRTLTAAVGVLISAHPLLPGTLIDTNSTLPSLTDSERRQLERYQSELQRAIVNLLQAPNPVDGQAILLAAARYQTISLTLATGRLLTLDPFSDDVSTIPLAQLLTTRVPGMVPGQHGPSDMAEVDSYYSVLLEQRRQLVRTARGEFSRNSDGNSSVSYAILESAVAQLFDLFRAKAENRPLQLETGIMTPEKSQTVDAHLLRTAVDVDRVLAVTKATRAKFKRHLLDAYAYHLITKNCVTELFVTLYSPFRSTAEIQQELGGFITPDTSLFFIPFISFDMVEESFAGSTRQILPSYRKRYLIDRIRTGGIPAMLRESNTLSSTIYIPWGEDTVFLFFTDDVFLLRPLYGALNLLYAAAGSVQGLLWLPVDEGRFLHRSLRGIVFSLPELGFWNIRKGTFPIIRE